MTINLHGRGNTSPLASPDADAPTGTFATHRLLATRRMILAMTGAVAASCMTSAWTVPQSAFAQPQATGQGAVRPEGIDAALAAFDEQIRQAGTAQQLADAAAGDALDGRVELLILQRELAARTGGTKLWEYAAQSREKGEFVSWLTNDLAAMRHYITGGAVWAHPQNGPTADDYIKSLDVFRRIHAAHGEDLAGADADVYLRMMISASMDVSNRIRLWTGDPGFVSDPLVRYETIKTFRADPKYRFRKDVFDALPVESMRYVFENQITDDELPWLANYSLHRHPDATNEKKRLDAYSYIWYGGVNNDYTKNDGYSDARFYDEALFSGPVTELKPSDGKGTAPKTWNGGWREKYRLVYDDANFPNAAPTDPFHIGCAEVSQAPGATANKTAYHRLWMVFEKGGVCGSLAKTYSNLNGMVGVPSYVIGQPGHAAAATYELCKDATTGKMVGTYSIQNAVVGWARSKSPSVAHWLCGWGRGRGLEFAAPYALCAQDALNSASAYRCSYVARLVAASFEGIDEKMAAIDGALRAQPLNLDALEGKIALLEQGGAVDDEWRALAASVSRDLAFHPLPMNDLLKRIESKAAGDDAKSAIATIRSDALAAASAATEAETVNMQACKDVAAYILKNEVK